MGRLRGRSRAMRGLRERKRQNLVRPLRAFTHTFILIIIVLFLNHISRHPHMKHEFAIVPCGFCLV